jgi:20S proteasome alpha/beta subunit
VYAQAFVISTSSSFSITQDGALSLLLDLYTHGSSIYLQSIMEHNGGSVVAMAGKDCVAIASDLRLGAGAMTVAMNFEKVSHGFPPLLFHY